MPTHNELLNIIKRYKKKKCPSHSTGFPLNPRGKPKGHYFSKNKLQQIINNFSMIPVVFPPPPSTSKSKKKKKKAIRINSINNFNEPIAKRTRSQRR